MELSESSPPAPTPTGLIVQQFRRVNHLFLLQIYPQNLFYTDFPWIPRLGRKGKEI